MIIPQQEENVNICLFSILVHSCGLVEHNVKLLYQTGKLGNRAADLTRTLGGIAYTLVKCVKGGAYTFHIFRYIASQEIGL